jgi:hypothetical protein
VLQALVASGCLSQDEVWLRHLVERELGRLIYEWAAEVTDT